MAKRDITNAIKIAEQLARVQGNVFIKDLLRKKKRTESRIRIGATKDAILENLIEAIQEGYITRTDLDLWVQEVEGWGKQHVYLYRVAKSLADDPLWQSRPAVQRKIKQTLGIELSDIVSARLEYPEDLKISDAEFSGGVLALVWRRRYELWDRDKSKDERRTIDGDVYQFRAYRQQLNRAVTRFVVNLKDGLAALFLQIPLADPAHAAARDMVKETVDAIFPWDRLKPVNLSEAIKTIDGQELRSAQAGRDSQIVAQSTRFAAAGASVAFEADPGNTQWKSVEAVRRVRGALKERDFTGDSATFQVRLRGQEGMSRDVLMSLHAKQRRVYLSARMTASEVWSALGPIYEAR